MRGSCATQTATELLAVADFVEPCTFRTPGPLLHLRRGGPPAMPFAAEPFEFDQGVGVVL